MARRTLAPFGRRRDAMVDVYNGGMAAVSGSPLSLSLSRKVPFWSSIEPSNILQEATGCF